MNIEDRVDRMAADLEKFIELAQMWQLLFDECPLGIVAFDSNMKFSIINNAFIEMTGYSNDILGKNISDVLPERFKKMHKKMERQYAKKPEKKTNRHGLTPYILTVDGRELLVDIDLSHIKYDGAIYYVAFIRRVL